jgi:hypothetical protein
MESGFSLRRFGIFGSHARGAADEGSDIDLLIELDEPTFDNYMNLKSFWRSCSRGRWTWSWRIA